MEIALAFDFVGCYTHFKATDCFSVYKTITFPQVGRTGLGEPSESFIFHSFLYIPENLAFTFNTFQQKQDLPREQAKNV